MSQDEIARILAWLHSIDQRLEKVENASELKLQVQLLRAKATAMMWETVKVTLEKTCGGIVTIFGKFFDGVSGTILAIAVLVAVVGTVAAGAWTIKHGQTEITVSAEEAP